MNLSNTQYADLYIHKTKDYIIFPELTTKLMVVRQGIKLNLVNVEIREEFIKTIVRTFIKEINYIYQEKTFMVKITTILFFHINYLN